MRILICYSMKILWLTHRDPLNPKAGGAERIVFEVGKRLVKRGYDITIFSGGWKGSKRVEDLSGIHVMRFGYLVQPHLILPILLLKNEYDIIIADLGHAVPWITPILLRRKTIVSFLHLHARSLPGQVNEMLAYVITAIEKLYFIFYGKTNFVTISKTSYRDLIRLGIKEEWINIIKPGVNSELFIPLKKTEYPSIVYYGGMRPYKRPGEVLYLLKELLNNFSGVKLKVVGEGHSRPELNKLCDELGINKSVEFTGRISDSELSKIVASSWLNIHSSVTEGWGISIIEASSAGTPTVAYKVPGVSDSIENGLNGLTVEDGNRNALIEAALTILKEPKKWWLSSIDVAKKYSWDKTTEMWETIIQESTKH